MRSIFSPNGVAYDDSLAYELVAPLFPPLTLCLLSANQWKKEWLFHFTLLMTLE